MGVRAAKGCGAAGLAAVLLAGAPLAADEPELGPYDRNALIAPMTAAIPVYGVAVGVLVSEPERFYGHLVAVPAAVEQVFSEYVFTVGEGREGTDVIVIAPRPAPSVAQYARVLVIGHLRPLNIAELEKDYDWFDARWLSGSSARLQGGPVLIAASIVTESGEQLLSPLLFER
jgi:hypothetical protein